MKNLPRALFQNRALLSKNPIDTFLWKNLKATFLIIFTFPIFAPVSELRAYKREMSLFERKWQKTSKRYISKLGVIIKIILDDFL